MGYKVEHNTMIRLIASDSIKADELETGKVYEIKRPNPRLYPVEIPLLLLDEDWTAIGYARVKELELSEEGSEIEFELILKFDTVVSSQYTKDLIEALKYCGYL